MVKPFFTAPPLENGDRLTRVAALLNGHLAELLAKVQAGVSTTEHQTFVERFSRK